MPIFHSNWFLQEVKVFVLMGVYDNVMWLLEALQQVLNDRWNEKSLSGEKKACTALDDTLPTVLTRGSFTDFPPQSAMQLLSPEQNHFSTVFCLFAFWVWFFVLFFWVCFWVVFFFCASKEIFFSFIAYPLPKIFNNLSLLLVVTVSVGSILSSKFTQLVQVLLQ